MANEVNSKTRVNISNYSDLEYWIQTLSGNVNIKAGSVEKKKEQPKEITKTATEKTLDEMKSDIQEKMAQKKDFINSPPLFMKPAFYLDRLAPYLKIRLYIVLDNSSKRYENSERKVIEKYIDILQDPVNDINNHLISFKAEMPVKADSIEFTLIDVRSEILDFIIMNVTTLGQFGQMQYFDIEFGWTVEKSYQNVAVKDYKNIQFTQNILCPFLGVKVSYDNNGVPRATFSCGIDQGFTGVLRFLNPYNLLGKLPGITLILTNLMTIFNEAFDKELKDSKNKIINYNDLIQFLCYALYHSGIQDEKISYKIIKDFFMFKEKEKNVTINYDKLNSNVSIVSSLSNKNKFKQIGISLYDMIVAKPGESQESYSDLFTMMLAGKIYQGTEVNKLFANFFTTLGIAVQEVGVIHPWWVYTYSVNILRQTAEKKSEIVLFELDGFNIDKTLVSPVKNEKTFWDEDFETFGQLNKSSKGDTYFKKANEFVCAVEYGWDNYLKTIANSIKVSMPVTAETCTFFGIDEKEIDKKNNTAPVSIGLNFFNCKYKAAKENANQYLNLYEARIKFVKNNEATVFASMKDKILGSLEKAKSNIEAISSKIIDDGTTYCFLMRDPVPSDAIFNPEIGSNLILQAYSYRADGMYGNRNDFFNPGVPNCWSVSFPDVIEFTPEIDYHKLISDITTNAKMIGTFRSQDSIVVDNMIEQKTKTLLDQADDLVADGKKDWNLVKQLQAIKKQIDDLTSPDINPAISDYKNSNQINFSIDDYAHTRVSTDSEYSQMQRKKTVQELRKRIMLTSYPWTASLTVIGDASFGITHGSKYIFIKIINQDGSLSFFSGIYIIVSFVHEISAGKFITKFQLNYEPAKNDPNFVKQFNTMVFKADRMILNMDK